MEKVFEVPPGASIIDMTIFRDELIVCTSIGIFRLVNGIFKPILFSVIEDENEISKTSSP